MRGGPSTLGKLRSELNSERTQIMYAPSIL